MRGCPAALVWCSNVLFVLFVLCRPQKDNLMVKVGMVGDVQAGKTSLMVRYVEGNFDEDYIETLGVNFLEKTINLPRASVTFSVWDLGGECEPAVCRSFAHCSPDHDPTVSACSRGPRVPDNAAHCVQRCCGHPFRIRPHPQVDAVEHQGMVPPGPGLEQGEAACCVCARARAPDWACRLTSAVVLRRRLRTRS